MSSLVKLTQIYWSFRSFYRLEFFFPCMVQLYKFNFATLGFDVWSMRDYLISVYHSQGKKGRSPRCNQGHYLCTLCEAVVSLIR